MGLLLFCLASVKWRTNDAPSVLTSKPAGSASSSRKCGSLRSAFWSGQRWHKWQWLTVIPAENFFGVLADLSYRITRERRRDAVVAGSGLGCWFLDCRICANRDKRDYWNGYGLQWWSDTECRRDADQSGDGYEATDADQ